MSNAISPTCSQNSFDRVSARLEETADELDAAGSAQRSRSVHSLRRAAEHATDSVLQLGGAAANAALAAAKTAEGAARHAESAGRLVAGGGIAVAGVAVRSMEEVAAGARAVARTAARGFASLANGLSRLVGDGKSVTVRELEAAPSARRVSDRLFAAAGRQLDQAGAARAAGWSAWTEAVTHLAGSAANVGLAAGHALAAAGNVATAAARAGTAAALETGELGVRLASAAVQAAEQGVEGARALAILSARFSAATANALALPDHATVEVRARLQLEVCEAEVRQFVARQPELRRFAAQWSLCAAAR